VQLLVDDACFNGNTAAARQGRSQPEELKSGPRFRRLSIEAHYPQACSFAAHVFKRHPGAEVPIEAGLPQAAFPRDLTAIMKITPLEEHIYRHRCVETWSIVVPWIGFSLSELLKLAVPNSKARFVAFQSY
jgi:hypothetical protein